MVSTNIVEHEKRVFNILTHTFDAKDSKVPEDYIVDSWRRCTDQFGLVPNLRPESNILSSNELAQAKEKYGQFLQVAEEECRDLYEQTKQSGYVIVLTDTNGVILSMVGDPSLDNEFKRLNIQCGAMWMEQHHGTNGMGTCLYTGLPTIIHGGDHFFSDYRNMTCTAAPIHDPHGKVIAVLDATSFQAEGSKRGQIHTRALVQMAANFIEYRYFQRYYRDAAVLGFHPRSEFLGVGTESLLAIDKDGSIIGANRCALNQLEIDDRKELIDTQLTDILSLPSVSACNTGFFGLHGIVPAHDLRNGRRFYSVFHHIPEPALRNKSGSSNTNQFVTVYPSNNKDCADFKSLAGKDPRMAYNVRCIQRVLDKGIYVLLSGETGTGKDVFTRAIHNASKRRDKPFVALNCAAIPESLIESELFGYKSGAFTGARRSGMRGCILESNGGTLFLDEIGDMPLQLQTRLLRVLETKEVLPLGSHEPIKVDLNVISASHQDLRGLIDQGKFRQDLFYRLNGITLKIPALRERKDIDNLIRCTLAMENHSDEPILIERKAFTRLMEFPWPGNIRELRNVIRTAIALSDDNAISLADLPREIANLEKPVIQHGVELKSEVIEPVETSGRQLEEAGDGDEFLPLENAVRETILQELERNRWNVTATAKRLDMSRCTLYRKLKKYNIPVSTRH
jgi:transcriptional regulator of acetoin/glycerol metabolism